MNIKEQIIRDKIKQLEEEILELKKTERKIRSLDNYSLEEKEEAFDNLYNHALSQLRELEETGSVNDDSAHFMFEAMMELLSMKGGPRIWEYYNTLGD
jgi:hypothetical protein